MTFFLLYLGNRQKPRRKSGKNFFFSGGRLKKILGGETLAPCVLGLEKSVLSLGLEGCVLDSTSVKLGMGTSLYSLPLIK